VERTPWQRVVFDFDGTLAHRPGLWSQALLDVLDELAPGHTATRDELREALRDGFPWHRPNEPHPHLGTADAWWEHLGGVLGSAFTAAGVERGRLPELLGRAREHYCDPARFTLYDDTRAALQRLRDAGIDVVILSNHVPELAQIVEALGLADDVIAVISSAVIGYEKPHPEAFQRALVGVDPARCWMIGDNPTADVEGGRAAGMQALLVRHPDVDNRTVGEAVDLVLASRGPMG
jgi:putative hydrolase of the HAD superfamily